MREEIRLANKNIVIIILALGLSFGQFCYSQTQIQPGLYKSEKNSFEFEINEIKFVGNTTFGAKDLSKTVLSKTSSRNPIHSLSQYYYDNLKKIKITPKPILTVLKRNLKSFEKELRYFNTKTADADTNSVINFYNKNGFHSATAYYIFKPDSTSKMNILTFYIKEGVRTKIGSINYFGMDNLENDLKAKVTNIRQIKVGDNFSEDIITNEMLTIQALLLDNGYFFTKIAKPLVFEDYLGNDSVVISINIGKKQTIGEIVFEDNLKGQKYITNRFKSEQLDFKTGDVYNRSLLIRSQDNLKSLGIFDVVKIDTLENKQNSNDSVINFKISSQYTKQQDWGVGFFVNQFANPDVNDMFNAGIQLDYGHKNLFGIAQQFRPFAKIYIRDINNRPIDKLIKGEWEYQLGFRYAQPSLWQIDRARFGFETAPVFSSRSINVYSTKDANNHFTLQTISIPFRSPIKFPAFTIFKSAIIDLTFEYQNPKDYNSAIAKGNLPKDSAQRYEILYRNLNDYLYDEKGNSKGHLITSGNVGLTFIGDRRNQPFSPTSGYYISLFGEITGWFGGLAHYGKAQLNIYHFSTIADNTVFAIKIKSGYIGFTDENNKYIPVERQYFAGGANGNRGFVARRLRYSKLNLNTSTAGSTSDFLQEFVGSSTLIEGSFELRYKFTAPENYDELVAYNINASGIVGFIDYGNAFGWFVPEDKTGVNLAKIAVSGGVGYRYDTPLGPVRLDLAWPLVDPLQEAITLRRYQFHLALGHAF